jgi:hypothetical protein
MGEDFARGLGSALFQDLIGDEFRHLEKRHLRTINLPRASGDGFPGLYTCPYML